MGEITRTISVLAWAVVLLSPLIVLLVAIIKRAANEKFKMQKQSELLFQIIERGTTENLDLGAIASAFNQQKSIKQSLLNTVRSGTITAALGVAMLILGVMGSINPNAYKFLEASTFYIVAAILLACGITLIIYYFIAKRNLRIEIEQEEKNAQRIK